MLMYFKQRMFSWLDSYDIYDEAGNTLFVVKGQLSWGHCLKIYDCNGYEVGTIKEKVLSFLPRFEVYFGNQYFGCIRKELSFFKPKYIIEYNGWNVRGNFMEWDYEITNPYGNLVAAVSKQLFHLTDQYVIEVIDPQDALFALMLVLAIDAEKCSRND